MTALPSDPLYSAKLRIERADEHIKTLDAEIDGFFAKNPGRVVAEHDPDGPYIVHRIKFDDARFPIGWRILGTEIIEHLRASLDHATFATFFFATGNTGSNYAAFPFGKTPPDLDNSVRGRSKDLRPEIQTLLRSFNAYKGGNDLLYSLNELSNASKHSLISFIVGAVLGMEIRSGSMAPVEIVQNPIWDSVKNEIIYARSPVDFHFQCQVQLQVYVALGDMIESVRRAFVQSLFMDMSAEVKRVVSTIEAESRRIGILI